MSNSLKIAALFLWVLSAIYIKEDAKQTIKDHYPVALNGQKMHSQERVGGDSVAVIQTRAL